MTYFFFSHFKNVLVYVWKKAQLQNMFLIHKTDILSLVVFNISCMYVMNVNEINNLLAVSILAFQ